MGERKLSKYQFGIESTRGTAVAATRIIGADIKAVPKDRVWEAVMHADGSRVNANRKRNDELFVKDALTISQGYFQIIPMLGICSLDGTISPAEQTPSQSDYLWAIAPSLTAANDPDTITLECGDDTQAYEIEYVMFDSLKFSGEIAQAGESSPVSIEAGYFGRQVTPTTFTAAQSLHSGLTLMNAKLARLYSDTTWAGIGGTELTSLLRGFELEIMIGNHAKFMGSANKYFTTHGEGEISAILTLALEGGSSADTLFDLFQAGTERALRLDINGPQIGSGVNYQFRADIWGFFEDIVPLGGESAGNNLHTAVIRSVKDVTSSNMLACQVITNNNTV
jgi:hypothetical protein